MFLWVRTHQTRRRAGVRRRQRAKPTSPERKWRPPSPPPEHFALTTDIFVINTPTVPGPSTRHPLAAGSAPPPPCAAVHVGFRPSPVRQPHPLPPLRYTNRAPRPSPPECTNSPPTPRARQRASPPTPPPQGMHWKGGRYPLCDIPSGCCSFTGPWTVTRSSLRMLRRVAAFCRPLRPVLLLVSPLPGTPPPFQGAQPMPSHCPPDAKCQPQWHL